MLLSSRQAAILLDTHESSIKRWCNAGELECQTTSGGHRRIALEKLVRFASKSGLHVDVLVFQDDAQTAVNGLLALRRSRVPADLQDMVKQWLLDAQSYRLTAFMRLAKAFGIGLPVIYDRLIGGVMRDVGDSWARGAFRIGEEHRISEAILDVLYAQQAHSDRMTLADSPTAVLGAIRDEEHVTGAMMVRTLLTESGWKVAYLGRNVPEEDFVLFQHKVTAPLVCLSATISRTPESIMEVVNRVLELGDADSGFLIAVGGSGAKAASRLVHLASDPGRVRFFDSATDFASWSTEFLSNTALVENETH